MSSARTPGLSRSTTRVGFHLGMANLRRIRHTLAYLVIIGLLVILLLPLLWVASAAFQTENQLRITLPVQWIPHPFYLGNFADGWQVEPWLLLARNTLIFAVGSCVGLVASTTLVSYAFARMRFPGRDALMFLNISLMLLPYQVTMVPTFILFSWLHWVGTFKPVIVPFFFASAPYYVFLLREFFRAIPHDLSDAARIDGANEVMILWRIIVPLSKPILAVMVVFHLTWAWNDYILPLIYLSDAQHQTLVLGLQVFIQDRGQTGWGPLMAMALLIAIPVMFLYFYIQQYITQAFVISGLK